jgi:hypothetical protein
LLTFVRMTVDIDRVLDLDVRRVDLTGLVLGACGIRGYTPLAGRSRDDIFAHDNLRYDRAWTGSLKSYQRPQAF